MSLYILVADPGRARIYRTTTPVLELDIVYNQTNFAGRKNLTRPGQSATYNPREKNPDCQCCSAEKQEADFVSDVCRVLQKRLSIEGFDGLVLITPRELMHRFLRRLNRQCQELLTDTITKPPGPMSEQDVIRALAGI